MAKIVVTGGSGFIGTNLVEYLAAKGHDILNVDFSKPRKQNPSACWENIDIRNKERLKKCIQDFMPEYVVHLAARTDLYETRNLQGYDANIIGVSNVVDIINGLPSVKRTIYASSRMVCRIDYVPETFFDYCPPNLYGESKVLGEKFVRENAKHDYVIVRPTSIWGPYFEVPYRTFFDTVRKGVFFVPKGHNPMKSFGFVLNTVFQIEQILFAPKSELEETYYLTDYPPLELKTWGNLVAAQFGKKNIGEIPMPILKLAALSGDVLQKLGWRNPPLTTFRLDNLITNMVYDTISLEKLCGTLPYSLNDGVRITADWMKTQ